MRSRPTVPPCKGVLALLGTWYIPDTVLSTHLNLCGSERGSHWVKVTPGGRRAPDHVQPPPMEKLTVT